MNISSPSASSIRFSAEIKLPADSTVIFYERGLSGQVRVIDSFTTTEKGLNESNYWSPQAPGESIGMEIRVPNPDYTNDVKLVLSTIAHRFDISTINTAIITNVAECTNHEEIQCAIDDEMIDEGFAKATMQLWYESEGLTYTCTGTLINVTRDEGFIPYVHTAAHCISTDA